jgi:UDP-N-acetylglucosamine 2-epimerase (non-hydrolysing)/UDP-GlcNAc3NAcA epimerase
MLPLAHVEDGMRSFDRGMPEEVNRVTADRFAGLLLCPTETAVENLRREGLGANARLVGDVMADVARRLGPIADRRSRALDRFGLERGGYLLATAHRAGNVDDPAALARLAQLLRQGAERHGPLVLPLHPRTRVRLARVGLLRELERARGVRLCEPLGYLDFACLLRGARAVLTDSGGLQKEAYLAGVPCVTLRESTEWVETVESGWNRLAGLDAEAALTALGELLERRHGPGPDLTIYGAGDAGARVVDELLTWLGADVPGVKGPYRCKNPGTSAGVAAGEEAGGDRAEDDRAEQHDAARD